MSVSYRASPVAVFNNRRGFNHATFGFPCPDTTVDPGVGGGGSATITVYVGGEFRLAWSSDLVDGGGYPPAGWTAQPSLTGSERWWPNGFHTYGRASYSPNYGYIYAGCMSLRPDGRVGTAHGCFQPPYAGNGNVYNSWKYLAPSSQSGGEGGANAWNFHLGFDYALRKDLVVMGVGGDIRLTVRSISGVWPNVATLGPVVWEGTPAEYAAGYGFYYVQNPGGDRHNLPWLGHWWIMDLSRPSGPKLWRFSSLSASNPIVDIPLDAGVLTRMGSGFASNLAIAIDHYNRRVIAGQADITQAPDGAGRYPIILWDVHPTTYAWTQITVGGSPLYVYPPAVSNIINPLTHAGAFKFNWWDRAGPSDWSSWSGAVEGTNELRFSTGGHNWINLHIPKSGNAPRSVTLQSHTFNSSGYINGEVMRQKHVEYAQAGPDGRVFGVGGDTGGGAGSGSQWVFSLNPEDPTSVREEQSYIITGKPVRPLHPDEVGFQWRAASSDFWFTYMYRYPYDTSHSDYASQEEWISITGGGAARAWRYNPTTKIWTTYAITPAPGFESKVWYQGDGVGGRWYHDPGADTMVAICFNTNTSISVMKCSDYTFKQYPANRLHDGATILPDGRSPTAIMGDTGWRLCGDDRATIDPATGMLYFWNSYTGDVYRCDTRASPYTYNSVQYLPIYWCFRLPCTYGTRNFTHFSWAKGVLWIVSVYRVYSWAPGEDGAWEHEVPLHFGATALCRYTVGGDERLAAMGSDGPYTYLQRHSAISSRDRTWYTLELSV